MRTYSLDKMQLTGEIVFVRIDGNVPSDEYGNITDDFRLKAVLDTVKYVSERASVTIIGTHRGRPDKLQSLQNQALSNNILCHWFNQQGLKVHFFEDLSLGLAAASEKKHSIILLENLRYYQGEKDDSSWLSDKIASVATIYVNDAMSMLHRSDGSIVNLPQLIQRKAYGFRVQQELDMLKKFIDYPAASYGLLLGGNKSKDKLIYLEKIIKSPVGKRPDFVLLGGLLAIPFLIVQGKISPDIRLYDINNDLIDQAKRILDIADGSVEILLPIDHEYQDGVIVDIGLQTVDLYKNRIQKIKKIFINGTMGKYEQESGAYGTKKVLEAVAKSTAISLIGGGNAVDAASRLGIIEQFSYVSVGGGATFAFLSASDPWNEMPGLKALSERA